MSLSSGRVVYRRFRMVSSYNGQRSPVSPACCRIGEK